MRYSRPLIHQLKPGGLIPAFLLLLLLPPAQAEEAITVEAIEVGERRLVEEVPLSGTVYSPRISMVSAQVEGLVLRVHADAGDRVDAGDTLLELDTELTLIAREEAAAEKDRAETALQDAKRRLDEARSLAERNNIAASDVSSREAEAASLAAELRAAEARVRRIEAELARHRIKAPFTGVVSQKEVSDGEWVTPGTSVFELVDDEHLSLDFQVPQRYYAQAKENAELALRFDTYPGRQYMARVHRTVPLSQSGARTFLLRARLVDQPAPALIPGMSVSGSLRLDTDTTRIAVPRDALIRYPDGRVTVWLVTDASWDKVSPVREQKVETGLSADGWVEIEAGLEEGQVVVTRGNEALREGRPVRPRNALADHEQARR